MSPWLIGLAGYLLAIVGSAFMITMFEAATTGTRAEYLARFRSLFGGNFMAVSAFTLLLSLIILGLRFVILAVFGV